MFWIQKLFTKRDRLKTFFPLQTEYPTESVFTIADVEYFRFTEMDNLPPRRALSVLSIYEEFKMHCSVDFLRQHTEKVKEILENPKSVKIIEIHKLNSQLRERLDFIFEPDLVYKLASVLYFDQNESPYTYDWKYNEQKIKFWKETEGVEDFFSREPISKLIPSLKGSQFDFQMYTQVVKQISDLHWESISTT